MDPQVSAQMDSAETETSMIERAPVPQEQIVPDLLKVSPMTTSTATDVGSTAGTKLMRVDGALLTYLNTQLAAGAKPAFLLRNKGDYDVATEGNPSGVNTRAFDGTALGTAPVFKMIYETVATVTHNSVVFGTNF